MYRGRMDWRVYFQLAESSSYDECIKLTSTSTNNILIFEVSEETIKLRLWLHDLTVENIISDHKLN